MNEQYLGSDFDDFLAEENLLEHCQAVAIKRVIAFQLMQFIEENKLSKSEVARQLQTSRTALDRLLNPNNTSVTLESIVKVARLTQKRLSISLA
ncbi:MAG: Fis family transcriptional regulator [Methylococcales bacterium]|jgi:predicted XRE-type DNA-binding protein|nr:Fis family transcriptional regulator [Methylococcales bacterium]